MPYRRIVVGTDGSPRAEQAVHDAGRLAAIAHARLIVVTAFARHPAIEREAQAEAPADVRWAITDRATAEAKATGAAAAARVAGAGDVHVLAEEGTPDEVLLGAVEAHGADLLVVGSKGMTDASRFLIGSVANMVSHHAVCDVLIVHTDEGDA